MWMLPSTSLACTVLATHADLSSACFVHPLTPIDFRLFSIQYNHLHFGLPAFLLLSGFPRNTLFTVLWSIIQQSVIQDIKKGLICRSDGRNNIWLRNLDGMTFWCREVNEGELRGIAIFLVGSGMNWLRFIASDISCHIAVVYLYCITSLLLLLVFSSTRGFSFVVRRLWINFHLYRNFGMIPPEDYYVF
jgi:hypothetical protein